MTAIPLPEPATENLRNAEMLLRTLVAEHPFLLATCPALDAAIRRIQTARRQLEGRTP